MPSFHEIAACRSCVSTRLLQVLDLGEIHLSGFLLPSEPDTPKTPIVLVLCENCSLLQLKHYVDPDVHFKTFSYRSGLTTTMREALLDVVEECKKRVHLRRGDTVIDIGSNDSTLLGYWDNDLERIGFEPAENLMEEARLPEMVIVNDYFSHDWLRSVTGKRAKVITAIACMYDVNNINSFLDDVRKSIAEKDSLFCIQLMSLRHMLDNNDIGNLTQEHVCHYSLMSLEPLLERHGLYVFDCEENDVNGGSLRVYASPELRSPSASLVMQRHFERRSKFDTTAPYDAFATRADALRAEVVAAVHAHPPFRPVASLHIGVLGASTKGNLMLDYWGLGRDQLRFAAERDVRKLGLETSAGRIPIVTEQEARDRASVLLVLPYGFRKEIIKRECGWLKQGGRLIFPLPQLEIVTSCDSKSVSSPSS